MGNSSALTKFFFFRNKKKQNWCENSPNSLSLFLSRYNSLLFLQITKFLQLAFKISHFDKSSFVEFVTKKSSDEKLAKIYISVHAIFFRREILSTHIIFTNVAIFGILSSNVIYPSIIYNLSLKIVHTFIPTYVDCPLQFLKQYYSLIINTYFWIANHKS